MQFYILATDLDIGKTNWGDAQSHGSRSIHVWESSDGVNWSTERLVELMGPTAGYVWAPSATWDPAANAYAVFWSSQTYAARMPIIPALPRVLRVLLAHDGSDQLYHAAAMGECQFWKQGD